MDEKTVNSKFAKTIKAFSVLKHKKARFSCFTGFCDFPCVFMVFSSSSSGSFWDSFWRLICLKRIICFKKWSKRSKSCKTASFLVKTGKAQKPVKDLGVCLPFTRKSENSRKITKFHEIQRKNGIFESFGNSDRYTSIC